MSSLEELAEDIEAHLPPFPSTVRAELPDCVLVDNGLPYPPLCGAHRLRFRARELAERVATVRGWFAERGRAEFTWWVGPSATPPDLMARLCAGGAAPFADEPLVTQMVLTEPPPEVAGVEVRLVETFEEFAAAREIAWETTGFTEEQRDAGRAVLAERWASRQEMRDAALYVAFDAGRPVATGDVVFLPFAAFLSGAGTLPEARGRGAFRALVRARWDEAVRRGTPTLLVGAGKMSRPILERIGFRTLAEVRVLVDRTGLNS